MWARDYPTLARDSQAILAHEPKFMKVRSSHATFLANALY